VIAFSVLPGEAASASPTITAFFPAMNLPTTPPESTNTCAVVVTYNSDAGLAERIARISAQVSSVIIVDNGSTGSAVSHLDKISVRSAIRVIRNGENLGLASALNRGMCAARAGGFAWVITFDQDTIIREDLLPELRAVYDAFPNPGWIAVIGSNYLDPTRGRTLIPEDAPGPHPWAERNSVITSGSLIPLAAFDLIGPFLPQLYIDNLDDEFCLRARSKGFHVLLAIKPLMQHSLGLARIHRTPWGPTSTPEYPAARWYYLTRNYIILIRKYYLQEPRFLAAGLFHRAAMFAKVLWFEDGRLAKLSEAVAGLVDGIRSGRCICGRNRILGPPSSKRTLQT